MNIKEIFEEVKLNGEYQYDFDTEDDLDNVLSMNEFLECHLEYDEDNNVEVYDGTQVIFKHDDYNFKIVADSGGRGDFYSHKIEFSIAEE